jgi:hypothetical protein
MEHKIKTDDKYKYKDISMPTDQFREIEVIIDNFDKDTSSDNIEMGSFNVQHNTPTKKSLPKNKFKINNMQNIEQIHECFKQDGDLCEGDNITIEDVQNYRKQGLDLQTQYEFNRFMKH